MTGLASQMNISSFSTQNSQAVLAFAIAVFLVEPETHANRTRSNDGSYPPELPESSAPPEYRLFLNDLPQCLQSVATGEISREQFGHAIGSFRRSSLSLEFHLFAISHCLISFVFMISPQLKMEIEFTNSRGQF
jgi:hypothetical protein